MTRAEYTRLLAAAQSSGDERLALRWRASARPVSASVRSKYLTMEATQCGRAEIALKGKNRTILLPAKLCRRERLGDGL